MKNEIEEKVKEIFSQLYKGEYQFIGYDSTPEVRTIPTCRNELPFLDKNVRRIETITDQPERAAQKIIDHIGYLKNGYKRDEKVNISIKFGNSVTQDGQLGYLKEKDYIYSIRWNIWFASDSESSDE